MPENALFISTMHVFHYRCTFVHTGKSRTSGASAQFSLCFRIVEMKINSLSGFQSNMLYMSIFIQLYVLTIFAKRISLN